MKRKYLLFGALALDIVANVACAINSRKEVKEDIALKEALLTNRDAVIKRNEILEQELQCTKSLLDLVIRKKKEEDNAKEAADQPGV